MDLPELTDEQLQTVWLKARAGVVRDAALQEIRKRQGERDKRDQVTSSSRQVPTPAELEEMSALYAGGREKYMELRNEGRSHAEAMKFATSKFGLDPNKRKKRGK